MKISLLAAAKLVSREATAHAVESMTFLQLTVVDQIVR
jgi:hypothetical protein